MTKEMILSKVVGLASQAITYSEQANAFLGKGCTSAARNHYFSAVRFAEGILIKEDLGIGHTYRFINAIRIYSTKDKTLIADKAFHNVQYSTDRLKALAANMLMQKLQESAAMEDCWFDETSAMSTIRGIVDDAYRMNQLEMAEKQLRRLAD
jgi:hypothetical protein